MRVRVGAETRDEKSWDEKTPGQNLHVIILKRRNGESKRNLLDFFLESGPKKEKKNKNRKARKGTRKQEREKARTRERKRMAKPRPF